MSLEPLSEAISALSQFLVADATIRDTLQRIADITQRAVPSAVHVGISMLSEDGHPTTGIFTDEASPEIDQAQYDTGNGPCLASWREKRPVRIEDTKSPDTEYPEFARAAAEHGIGSTLSMPLVVGDHGIGAMNLYATPVNGFSQEDEATTGSLATTAAVVLSNAAAYWGAHQLSLDMRSAMESRSVIEQAKGILMATSPNLDAEGAFDLLVKASQRENIKLRDVAARIVADRDANG